VPERPESVLSRTREVEGVYVVREGKVRFRPVVTGIKGELDVEIVEGLEGGEEIVVGPFKALRELEPDADVIVDNEQEPEQEP
jgi:HlyD family secretion protein